MTERNKCLWTGLEFPAAQRGPHEKVFITDAARAEAHKAARMYALWLIGNGFLSWATLRAWYDHQISAPAPTNTTRRRGPKDQLSLDWPDLAQPSP